MGSGKSKGVYVCEANEWLRGTERGIGHVGQGLNFPAISTTPGLVLIVQDTSPNPLSVLLSVWSPLSPSLSDSDWTKAGMEKGPLFET